MKLDQILVQPKRTILFDSIVTTELLPCLLTLPVPIPDEVNKFKFLFSHFFVMPKKVL